MPQVSLSDAAKMVNITRSTLYAHIEEKGITVIDKGSKRPKIDVSELIRVYGSDVRPIEEIQKKPPQLAEAAKTDLATEVAVLRDRLKATELERERERRQLTDQIESLHGLLKKEQEVLGRVTALLTDQRSDEKATAAQKQQNDKLEQLEQTVKSLAAANTSDASKKSSRWWPFQKKG